MGYYTKHELLVYKGDKDNLPDHKEAINTLSGYGDLWSGDSHKWYGHKEDMIKYSKLYPDTIFMLEGEGEESPDFWQEYYQNGKMVRCKGQIVYENFNENQLK